MSALDGLRKSINKKYEKLNLCGATGLEVCRVGVSSERFTSHFSLGSPALNWMVYNSIPKGIFVEISGPEASGKTSLAFAMAASHIRAEKQAIKEAEALNTSIQKAYEEKCAAAKAAGKKVPEAPVITPYKPKHIMFVDAEGTLDPRWALVNGYNTNDEVIETLYYPGLGQSAEQILDDIVDAVKSGDIGLVILDSLVAISGQQTADATMEKKDMGGIAKILSDFTKRYTGLFNRTQATFIGLNGIYMDPSGYGNPIKTPCGEAWKRACSLRLRTKRGASFEATGKELDGKAENANKAVGHIIEVALLKTKFCRWDRRLATCRLDYVKGIDIMQDTIDTASLYGLIVDPSKGYFDVLDPDTGEVLASKIHGKGNVKPYFENHPEVFKRVYNKVYELMASTEVANCKTFEEMLGLSASDTFGIDFTKEEIDQNTVGD